MTSATDPGWHIDTATLLPVLDDEPAFRAANASDPALEVLVALWSGKPDQAAALLGPMIDADPTSWRLQALAADVIRDRGDVTSAVTILGTLVDAHRYTPREAVLVQHLGKALFAAGDFPGAAARFRRALSLRLAGDADPGLVASSRQALDRALELVPRPLDHTRDWGWGVAFVQDPADGEVPDVDSDAPVTIGQAGFCLLVRNASDVDGDEGPARVTIHVDQPAALARPLRSVVVDLELVTPSGSLSIGDADGEILVPVPGSRTRVVVSHHDDEWNQPDEAWIDLYPAD